MQRLERKPAGSDLPASVGKISGINADKPEVKTVSFDEMRSYVGARRGENRRSVRIWTAVVEEWDGSRRADFEIGRRDLETLMRPLRRTHGYSKRLYMLAGPLAMARLRDGLYQRRRV